MKKYTSKEELISDLRKSLKNNNPFDKYILDRLADPPVLIREFRENPNLALGNKRGDWLFLWRNVVTEIDGKWVKTEDLLTKLGEFLDEEK